MASPLHTARRVLNGLMAVAFLLSMVVQLNDPDPLPWMATYGAAALACLAWERRRGGRWPQTLTGGLALAWSLSILSQLPANAPLGPALGDWQMVDQGGELVRELGGLWLVCVWMGILCIPASPPP